MNTAATTTPSRIAQLEQALLDDYIATRASDFSDDFPLVDAYFHQHVVPYVGPEAERVLPDLGEGSTP